MIRSSKTLRAAVLTFLAVVLVCDCATASGRGFKVRQRRRTIGAADNLRILLIGREAGVTIDMAALKERLFAWYGIRVAQAETAALPSGGASREECAAFIERNFALYKPDMIVIMGGIYDGLPTVEVPPLRLRLESFGFGRFLLALGGRVLLPLKPVGEDESVPDGRGRLERLRAALCGELGISGDKGWRYIKKEIAPRPEPSGRSAGYELASETVGQAMDELESVLARDPERFDAARELAALCFHSGRPDKGLELARTIFGRAPDFAAGDEDLFAMCWSALDSQGRHAENFALHERLLALCVSRAQLIAQYNRMGFSLLSWKGAREAERFYKELALRFAGEPEALLHLGQFYLNAGRWADTQHWAGRVLEAFETMSGSDRDYACMLLFEAFIGLGRFVFMDADWFWARVREWNVDRGKYFSGMAVRLLEQGREKEAGQWFREADKFRAARYCGRESALYRQIAAAAVERGIMTLAMPYPLRRTKPMARMFGGLAEKVFFVGSFRTFREAVLKNGYERCFLDRVGADCGALSDEGMRIAAHVLAGRIGLILDERKELDA